MTPRCIILMVLLGTLSASAARKVSIDQVGYIPRFSKFAFVSSVADSFRVLDAATNSVRFAGALNVWRTNDPATGNTVRRGDFTTFQQSGEFFVVTSAGDSSERFSISDTVYNDAYRKALKGFYYQRCGASLLQPHAGVYTHAPCHTGDGVFHPSTDSSGLLRASTGGWHDAGDYGKYVVNAGISVGTLLMAYEYFPSRFNQDNINIPESGNGVPDILDEARYELEWLLKMQRLDGGVYCKLTRAQFEGFVMPQSDTATRYLYQVTSAATADFAAMMARAARIYLPLDTTFAQRCRAAAISAWSFIVAHPSIIPAGGFHNPAGTATGEYGDGTDIDERLWAAAELFVTTGAAEYNIFYQSNYSLNIFGYPMGWQDVRNLANITYMESQQTGTNETVRTQLRNALNSFCNAELSTRNNSGYQVALQTGDYYWGSNSVALNAAVLLLMGYKEFNSQPFLDVAADQMHYILGANAHSLSFVTAVGKRYTRHPHHRPSESDGIAEPVPGLMAGGPNRNREDAVLQALFTSSTPPALCYVDTMPSYASNEIAVNWNAPLVFVLGYFNKSGTTAPDPHGAAIPAEIQLHQNYPNPFNSTTQIRFGLASSDRIEFAVVDILGRVVAREQLGTFPSGENSYSWHAMSQNGTSLSTGIYFYYLTGKGRSELKRLVLLK